MVEFVAGVEGSGKIDSEAGFRAGEGGVELAQGGEEDIDGFALADPD